MAFRITIFAVEKNKDYYIFRVCVCRLSYLACNAHVSYCHLWPAPLYKIFTHYLINGSNFGKNFSENKMFVLIYSTILIWNIPHSKNKCCGQMWSVVPVCLHVKRPLFISYFNENCILSIAFRKKNIEMSNFMKIRPGGGELSHVGGRTDVKKLIVAFRKSSKPPKKLSFDKQAAFLDWLYLCHLTSQVCFASVDIFGRVC